MQTTDRVSMALRAHAQGLTQDELAATTELSRTEVGAALRELWIARRAASMWQDGPWYLIPPTVEG